jgi:hypothetical protein
MLNRHPDQGAVGPAGAADVAQGSCQVGLYPIVISQYSSATLYQVSYHIQ